MLHNMSVTMAESQLRSGKTGLSWNVTSPCKVQAEVQLCKKDVAGGQCEALTGSKKRLNSTGWTAVHRVHWVRNIPQASTPFMLKQRGFYFI